MPLPEGFNETEHLLDLFRREHNKAVNQRFKNQTDNDVTTPKASLKHASIIKDSDSAITTIIRFLLFEFLVGHGQSIQAPVYGVPAQEYQRNTKFKPQVKLSFKEKFSTELTERYPATGEITFRLMDESSESISRAKAEKLAKDIKREFTSPTFIWEKGWYKYTYKDIQLGYDFRLLVKSKTEGERIVRKVLEIQGHTFNNDNQQFIEHDKTYSLNPGTHKVYGRTVKKSIERPRVDVRFRYAQLLIHGQVNAVNLVAMSDVGFKSVIERINSV